MDMRPEETRPHHSVYLDRRNCCIVSVWRSGEGETAQMSAEYNAITGKLEYYGQWYDPKGDRPFVEYYMKVFKKPPQYETE